MLFGQTAVDRSMMTGESVPAEAAEGDSVVGGTIALTGRLVVRAVKVGRDTQLAHLIRLVEQAQAEKAAIQRLADRICGVFVPLVLTCAVLTLAGWLLAGSPAGHAFSAALAVLIIACPCALGLATPAALVAASGRGAQLGDLHQGLPGAGVVPVGRHGGAGQDRHRHHRPDVAGRRADRGRHRRAELLRYAGAVEQASEHAVAAAITAAAQAEAGPLPQAERFTALPGLGARGAVDGHEVVIGRAALFAGRDTDGPAGPGRALPGVGTGRLHHGARRLGRCRPRRRRGHRHGQAVRRGRRRRAARRSACIRSC